MAVRACLRCAALECFRHLYAGAAAVYSAAADGSDEREFLMDFFTDAHDMLSKLFLKGYQWPFDVRKVAGGSSIIDILVYLETCKGRKVYLDYRTNPADGEFSYDDLLPEAHEYLTRAGACFGTPIRASGAYEPACHRFFTVIRVWICTPSRWKLPSAPSITTAALASTAGGRPT